MPYFKPFPVADESALKRFGGRAQTVVRRCTRTLGAMSVFMTVVEAGSLSAAGRKLRMPLPTVSRRISELESHLKARLLIRSTTKLALTDAGKSYLAACKSIIESVDEAERRAAGEYSVPRGDLIIAAPIVFGRLYVVSIVAAFLEKYPDVDVQLVLEDRPLDLLENHIDLAVRVGELPDSSLIAARVGQIRISKFAAQRDRACE
jgi:DNA-binding transcriptional LysR family regulator